MNETTAPELLSVEDAADLLKVDPRTVQRRCRRGNLDCVKVPGAYGDEWRVVAASLPPATTAPTGTTTSPDKPTTGTTTRHDSPDTAATVELKSSDDSRDTSPDRHDDSRDSLAALLAEKDARIEDLRAQVDAWRLQTEAANRTASETTAALRKILDVMPKAIEAGSGEPRKVENSGQVRTEDGSRDDTTGRDENGQPVNHSGNAASVAQRGRRRKVSPLQRAVMRLVGIR